ncbi:hypothetical protein ACHAWF_018736, partial [Thalassiosira exigua]
HCVQQQLQHHGQSVARNEPLNHLPTYLAFDIQNESRNMPIETVQIVYVVAPSGTGKSFTGDYLAVAHGFEHVDGDWPFKHSHIPENAELSQGFLNCALSGGCKEEDRDTWVGYFEKIADMTVEAAKTHDRVVLSHATYDQSPRDVVVETLLKGGVKRDQITILQLTIDKDVLYGGLFERSTRQAEQQGKKLAEVCREGGAEFEGELTREKFIALSMAEEEKAEGDPFADEPAAIKVDVSSRGAAHLDGVDAAIGLARDGTLSYEEICAKVLPLDTKRDEESMACGGWEAMMTIFQEAMAQSKAILEAAEAKSKEKELEEEEAKSMKRRRSSLMQLQNELNSLRMSARNLEEVLEGEE